MITAWTESVNPIVVRDVRQGLRSRTFVATFSLLLLACVIAALTVDADDSGELLFNAYVVFLYVVCCLLQPVGAFREFARERDGDVWPALVLSGLRARAILRGKIVSQLVQGMLYASSVVPFLAFAYLLGGVSIVGMAAWLAGAFMVQALLTTLAIAGATFADTKRGRWVAQAGTGLGIWLLFAWGAGSVAMAAITRTTWSAGVLLSAPLALVAWASLVGLVFEAAAARLMAYGEDYVSGPRIALGVHLAAAVLFGMTLGTDATRAALGYGVVVLGLFGFLSVTDPAPPAGRWMGERKLFFLRSGPTAALVTYGIFLAGALVFASALGVSDAVGITGIGLFATSMTCLPTMVVRFVAPNASAPVVRSIVVGSVVASVIVGVNAREEALRTFLLPMTAGDPGELVPAALLALVGGFGCLAVLRGIEGAREARSA